MLSRNSLFAAILGVAAIASPALADVKLHSLFTENMVIQRDQPITVWGTAAPQEKVAVSILDGKTEVGKAEATATEKGTWSVELPKVSKPGTEYSLTITGKNKIVIGSVAVGDVWLCSGQSNMEWRVNQLKIDDQGKKVAEKAANPMIRLFDVSNKTAAEPQKDVVGKWQKCTPESVINFSAVGYFFGRDIEASQKVPIGLLASDWGGTPAEAWTSTEKLTAVPELKHYTDRREAAIKAAGEKAIGPGVPSSLYNGMIAPLLPFKIKGAIWYQGESNASRAAEYRTLFTSMIEDWRKQWGYEFPFLLVQLAPFRGGGSGVDYAELRDAQTFSTKKLKNVGMAVITDAGHETDIHPQKKEPAGVRLALAARALAYGEKIEFSGPEFESIKIEGNKAVLSFSHIGKGLDVKGETLTGFALCGDDKKFYPAKAEIKGDSVVLTSEMVTTPIAARYGWVNFAKPELNFFNKDGLPAVPFRTDDFPLTTAPKK